MDKLVQTLAKVLTKITTCKIIVKNLFCFNTISALEWYFIYIFTTEP